MTDPLGPARGCLVGLVLGAVLWAGLLYLLFRFGAVLFFIGHALVGR